MPDLDEAQSESAVAHLQGVQTEALVVALGRKRGERLIMFMADRLASPGRSRAARLARVMFRRQLPGLLDALRGAK